jgi:hypothetical protein
MKGWVIFGVPIVHATCSLQCLLEPVAQSHSKFYVRVPRLLSFCSGCLKLVCVPSPQWKVRFSFACHGVIWVPLLRDECVCECVCVHPICVSSVWCVCIPCVCVCVCVPCVCLCIPCVSVDVHVHTHSGSLHQV